MSVERNATRQRILIVLACFGAVILLTNLALVTATDFGLRIEKLPLPAVLGGKTKDENPGLPILQDSELLDDFDFGGSPQPVDQHPISGLMEDAAYRFREYDSARSKTFAQCVKRYRQKYGRHPPPGFDKWYIFARERSIYHLDDFDQILDDLRPFFSIPPLELRTLVRGLIEEDPGPSGLAGLAIKSGKVTILSSASNWRAETFAKLLRVFAAHLPNMEIAMNRHDQPRVVVPWEALQAALRLEEATRAMPPDVRNEWTTPQLPIPKDTVLPSAEWFAVSDKPYMDLAAAACPPDSYARNNDTMDPALAEAAYKLPHSGGLVSNFNVSTDLCTVGPAIAELHGFLSAPLTAVASRKLLPVFGECKVNVNNDILFPANMYYMGDRRYDYDGTKDAAWEDKTTRAFWRGVSSGGVQTKETWRRLHRHRFVLMTNATSLAASGETRSILTWHNDTTKTYAEKRGFVPVDFARQFTDTGFSDLKWCAADIDCEWLKEWIHTVPQTTMTDQFQNKFLVDVDGHSFSGRWHAFLKSRSLGFKATLFKEWHDSRLFEWLHFVPMDNSFDDFYTLLTYFVGLGSATAPHAAAYVPSHDFEAKQISNWGRDWAKKVLRHEDIEIYTYRLMLEYGRLLDDNRDRIGYGGDGSEMVEKWSW